MNIDGLFPEKNVNIKVSTIEGLLSIVEILINLSCEKLNSR